MAIGRLNTTTTVSSTGSSLTYSSGVLTQMTENFSDGSTNVTTFNYTSGVLTSTTETNPVRTTTYTYTSGVLTSVTVS